MLKHKVEIYVPINTPKQEKVMQDVFRFFCEMFGGASVNPVLSGWIDGKGTLVTDKIGIIYSYVPVLTKARRLVKKTAVEVRKKLNEDAVTVVIDGEASFY